MGQGAQDAELDFASVQRANPEMQRRVQEVLATCQALGADNPLVSVHDVGAGGLSNALPELVHDGGVSARFDLRAIPSAEPGMSPLEVWCNESQERYVLAVRPDDLESLEAVCARERCPYAVVGHATSPDQPLVVQDPLLGNVPVQLPLDAVLGKPPKMHRTARSEPLGQATAVFPAPADLRDAAHRVLRFPAVADKTFLITIGDRSITGMVARDQMVGPWQVPVADVAVTTSGYDTVAGEAMAVGERPALALLDAPQGGAAAARMAIGEALTNLAAASVERLEQVVLSANWMASAGDAGEDAVLFEMVRTVGHELCPALGICIPVGKDSMSMRTRWSDEGGDHHVRAPVTLIVTAFAPCSDATRTLTPQLRTGPEPTRLLMVDLGRGKNRLGGSVLAQVYGGLGAEGPDLDSPALLSGFFAAIQELNAQGRLLAYHDRSDGGLWATLCEMAFAGRCGVQVRLPSDHEDPVASLFAEELGAVFQVREADVDDVSATLAAHGLEEALYDIGRVVPHDHVEISHRGQILLQQARSALRVAWSTVTWSMQRLRDDEDCADEEHAARIDGGGLAAALNFELASYAQPPSIPHGSEDRLRVAILREQGTNGHREMAAAFHRAGFTPIDVHMSDLVAGRQTLQGMQGLVACGGFSYGDVLGAGLGWAKSVLLRPDLRASFADFFARDDTFSLGVCNGCQMLAGLRELIPGAEHWPQFVRNRSEQFEARLTMVRIEPSASLFFRRHAGLATARAGRERRGSGKVRIA